MNTKTVTDNICKLCMIVLDSVHTHLTPLNCCFFMFNHNFRFVPQLLFWLTVILLKMLVSQFLPHVVMSLASQRMYGSDWVVSQMTMVYAQNFYANVTRLWNHLIVICAAQRENVFGIQRTQSQLIMVQSNAYSDMPFKYISHSFGIMCFSIIHPHFIPCNSKSLYSI